MLRRNRVSRGRKRFLPQRQPALLKPISCVPKSSPSAESSGSAATSTATVATLACASGRTRCLLCTPTLISKRDIQPADICLCDLDGNMLAGNGPRTSELLLHLEIYKANPRARAVVHCHPPHATAFAITGTAPPIGLIPEYEIFIGPAAVARYETPGTQAFAETVLPFIQDHNTILLSNHGIVCWADTVTHSEWLVEILENYCKTYLIAQQIGKPLAFLPDEKIQEILALKRRMGLPDARIAQLEPHE